MNESQRSIEAETEVYRLDRSDVESAVVVYVHDTGRGGIVVCFKQSMGGIDVYRDEVKLLLERY